MSILFYKYFRVANRRILGDKNIPKDIPNGIAAIKNPLAIGTTAVSP